MMQRASNIQLGIVGPSSDTEPRSDRAGKGARRRGNLEVNSVRLVSQTASLENCWGHQRLAERTCGTQCQRKLAQRSPQP
eukprot:6277917-Alexandrium_andersonii.AAC.1